MAGPVLDANGRPYTRPRDEGSSPLGDFAQLPSVRDRGSYFEIDKAAFDAIRREGARRVAVSGVPSTPRDMQREVGGMAVGKGHGRWPHLTMQILRELRETAPILQPIHNARGYQVRRLAVPWGGKPTDVGIRVVHKDHKDQKAVQPEGFQRYIRMFEEILWKPAPSYGVNTLGTFLTLCMEDLLTINRPVVEPIHSLIDARRIVQWRPVDGALIWPTLLVIEKWMADNPRWSVGYDRGRLRPENIVDIVSTAMDRDLHASEYVLVRDGIAEAVYPRGRLICAPIMNRTDVRHAGYPPSHVEQAIGLISAFISTFDYNNALFTRGVLAEFILGLPAELHDKDFDAFVDMFREVATGVKAAHQIPIVPMPHGNSTIQKIDLKSNPTEMGFETWLSLLLSMVAAVYRMDPSVLNAKPWDSGATVKLSEGNRTEEIGMAREEGLQGDMGHLIENILNPLAMSCHPDLRVIAEYGDYDAQKAASITDARVKVNVTRNEARLEDGKDPIGFMLLSKEEYDKASPEDQAKHDENPYNHTSDPVMANWISQKAQRDQQQQQFEAMQQQGQQPGQDPSQGVPDGYGGADDGFGGAHPAHDPAPYGTPQAGPPAGAPPGGPKPPGSNPPGGGGGAKPPPLAKGSRTMKITLYDRQEA